MVDSKAIWDVVDSLKTSAETVQRTAQAVVNRVDDEGRVWVSIPGGEVETPTETSDAEVASGDNVTVEWRGGKLYVLGNSSNPSVGAQRVDLIDELANQAYQSASEANANAGIAKEAADNAQASANQAATAAATADSKATAASTAATQAQTDAAAAQTAASNAQAAASSAQTSAQQAVADAATAGRAASVAQAAAEAVQGDIDELEEWFWHDTNGSHVLGATSGYRNDINSTGMTIVETATEEAVASFGADGAQVGKSDESHIEIDEDTVEVYEAGSTLPIAKFGAVQAGASGMGVYAYDANGTLRQYNLIVGNGMSSSAQDEFGIEYASILASVGRLYLLGKDVASGKVYEVYIDTQGGGQQAIDVYIEDGLLRTDVFKVYWDGDAYLQRTLDVNGEVNAGTQMNVERNSGNTYFSARRTDTGTIVRFGIGSSGTNHGVYSEVHKQWLIHSNGTNIYINGKAITGVAANRVFASPNGSAGDASFRALVPADLPTVPINKGGTGQTELETVTKIADVITAESGVTIKSVSYNQWGKMVMLNVSFARAAIANNTTVAIGDIAAGKRPKVMAYGGSAFYNAYITAGGALSVRNVSGSSRTPSNDSITFTYLLP